MSAKAAIDGFVQDGFGCVADAFRANFDEDGEIGASFAATVDGVTVVDLWGGTADADTGEPWREDTLHLTFSGTKGMSALCLAMLMDRGRLALDDRISDHWPEFGVQGKADITVAEALSHRARLPVVRLHLADAEDLLDQERMASALAAQAPETDPRTQVVYHALTFGVICNALMTRIDGRTIGRFFAEEVATPLSLELWVGLPPELEARVARVALGAAWPTSGAPSDPDPLWALLNSGPALFGPGELFWNTSSCHQGELAGSNAIGSARSIARMYGTLARGGESGGVRVLSEETLRRVTTPLAISTEDADGLQIAFGAGFMLQSSEFFGPPSSAFGHSGAGGTLSGAWPAERLGFAYGMNELRDVASDVRSRRLLSALHSALEQ